MPANPSHPFQKTVLIVEDNQLSQKLLTDILQYHGSLTLKTELGEAALQLARQHRPDLILMDIELPDLSGMEAARRLKEDDQTRTIPIIAVTASAMPGDKAQSLLSGCDAYISKPFDMAEFLKLVQHRIAGRT